MKDVGAAALVTVLLLGVTLALVYLCQVSSWLFLSVVVMAVFFSVLIGIRQGK